MSLHAVLHKLSLKFPDCFAVQDDGCDDFDGDDDNVDVGLLNIASASAVLSPGKQHHEEHTPYKELRPPPSAYTQSAATKKIIMRQRHRHV